MTILSAGLGQQQTASSTAGDKVQCDLCFYRQQREVTIKLFTDTQSI